MWAVLMRTARAIRITLEACCKTIPRISLRSPGLLQSPVFLLSCFRRARPHGLGLKRSVAHVEITLERVLALGLEQLLAKRVGRRVRERAKRAFEQMTEIDAGGLHANHGNGLVEPLR